MCAGNEMIIPHSCSCCQRVVDLDSSQSSFWLPLLRVDKSKPEGAGSKKIYQINAFVSLHVLSLTQSKE